MTGRPMLAAALAAGLPDWLIVSDARQLDTARKAGTCVLWTQRRTRPAKLGLDVLTDELTLWVLTATTDPAKIEDDLDDKLNQVLTVLEPHQAFAWTEADRGTLADKFEGWRLTITCLYRITQ